MSGTRARSFLRDDVPPSTPFSGGADSETGARAIANAEAPRMRDDTRANHNFFIRVGGVSFVMSRTRSSVGMRTEAWVYDRPRGEGRPTLFRDADERSRTAYLFRFEFQDPIAPICASPISRQDIILDNNCDTIFVFCIW